MAMIDGSLAVRQGVARFHGLKIGDGGASALLTGNYHLIDERVRMHGTLATEASIGKTTSAIKAAFAKVLEPLFRKDRHEKLIPVRITGTHQHPNFELDVGSKM
jgi:hypothetical protein